MRTSIAIAIRPAVSEWRAGTLAGDGRAALLSQGEVVADVAGVRGQPSHGDQAAFSNLSPTVRSAGMRRQRSRLLWTGP